MKIQYMSDLHMELWDNSRYIKANEFEIAGDVLVLAGDTFYLRDTVAPQKKFWNWVSRASDRCCWCPVTTSSTATAT